MLNIYDGKGNIRRATWVATFAVDQGGVEGTAEVITIAISDKSHQTYGTAGASVER